MPPCKPRPHRILAIDPISRGFGFAVLEGTSRLIDWGVVYVRIDKYRGCLQRIEDLIQRYRPETVITELTTTKNEGRCARVRRLIAGIRLLASRLHVRYRPVTWTSVRRRLLNEGPPTKYRIAVAITEQFPELKHRLPKPRKSWMSEDERMSIFDAVALGVSAFRKPLGSALPTAIP